MNRAQYSGFEEERRAFNLLRYDNPKVLEPYIGKFILLYHGEVFDSDTDKQALARRFFSKHGYVEVYIVKITADISVKGI